MLNRKSYLILLVAVLITILVGCGGGSSNLDVSTSGSGAQLKSISVTPTNPALAVNTSQQLTAIGIYADNTTKDLTAYVTWSSADTSVATIDNNTGTSSSLTSSSSSPPGHAYAYGKNTGTTTITATTGTTAGSTTLTVTSATLLSIAVTPTNPNIVNGTNQQFIATGTFSDNTTQDLTISVIWSSSAASVATISNAAGYNGLATSVAAGSTTITATSGSIAGTATLTVTSSGVVTLTWDAPTTNTDGSVLNPATDLSLYKIYYGTASQTYTQVVNVTNPGTTSITKTLNLSPGTYYFVVTTVNTSGQESSYSNEDMKTI